MSLLSSPVEIGHHAIARHDAGILGVQQLFHYDFLQLGLALDAQDAHVHQVVVDQRGAE